MQLQMLRTEVLEKENDAELLRAKIDELERKRAAGKESKRTLKKNLSDSRYHNETLSVSLQLVDKRLSELTQSYSSAKEKTEKLHADEVEELKSQLERMERVKKLAETSLLAEKKQSERYAGQLKSVREALDTERIQNESARRQELARDTNLELRLKDAEAQLRAINGKHRYELERKQQVWQQEADKLQEKLDFALLKEQSTAEQFKKKQTKGKDRKEKISELQDQTTELEELLDESRLAVEKKNLEMQQLQVRFERLAFEKDAMAESLGRETEQSQSLRQNQLELEESLGGEIAALREKNILLTGEVESKQTDLERLSLQLEQASAEKDSFQTRYLRSIQEKKEIDETLASLTTQYRNLIEMNNEIDQENQNSAHSEEREQLRAELESIQRNHSNALNQIALLEQIIKKQASEDQNEEDEESLLNQYYLNKVVQLEEVVEQQKTTISKLMVFQGEEVDNEGGGHSFQQRGATFEEIELANRKARLLDDIFEKLLETNLFLDSEGLPISQGEIGERIFEIINGKDCEIEALQEQLIFLKNQNQADAMFANHKSPRGSHENESSSSSNQ